MIRYFAEHPTVANLLMLLLLALGLSSLPSIKRETFPDFAAQEVEAKVVYPGASAEDVEEAICQRLEDAVDSISEVSETRCESREGLATLVAKMTDGDDIDRFLNDVKSEIEAISTLPEQAETPTIRQLGRTDRVVSIALTGPMTPTALKAYAEQLKDRLQALPNVSQVTVQGFSDHQLRIEIPIHVLHQYGLSMSAVADVIARQNLRLPAGALETRERDILIRFDDQRQDALALANLIVVAGDSGGEIRLGEIATITDRFELDEERILIDGQRAALLAVTKTKSEDTLTVVEQVKQFVERERQLAPPGVQLSLTQDIASIVDDRLRLLTRNGLQGLVLVFLTMWLFFQLRFAFWVSMGLPVAFLGGLFGMAWLGVSINMLSMVALLIALGLLMDDAIVIAENIATQLNRGKSAMEAAICGAREVAPGVLSSFLTSVAVFGPLAFLEGDIGKVMKVIPVVLILVLAVSLIEAFLILPHHLAHSLRHVHQAAHKQTGSRFRQRFEQGLDWVRETLLGRLIDTVIHARYLFVGVVIGVFLISLGMLLSGQLKFQAFPDIEGDLIEARLLLPQGTPLWRTEQIIEQLSNGLAQVNAEFQPLQPQQQPLVRQVSIRYNSNSDAYETGPHVATITADLLTAERRNGRLEDILQRWREATGPTPGVISLSFKEPTIGPGGLAIDIRLQGSDLDALKAASLALQEWLGHYRGVVDLSDDLRPGKPELRLALRDGALALGVDASLIANQVRAAFQGVTALEIQVGRESYEIDVRLQAADQASLDALRDLPITTASGLQIPLSEVATISQDRGYARINRIDGLRTVTIQGDIDTRLANTREVIQDTEQRFLPELQQRFPGVQIALEGQAAETSTTGNSLQRGFLLGLLGIFILLSFQFRSYLEPIAVMTAIPLALIGVVWGHLAMGLELSMPSMMGFVSLAGIVVNDSILLVTFLKLRQREGMATMDAAKQASRDRFRAVLLTSLTTIAGLLPLLAEKSLQAQVLIPLVTSIVFGLLATTLLVLLVVPSLYSILDDFGLTAAQQTEPKGLTTSPSPPAGEADHAAR